MIDQLMFSFQAEKKLYGFKKSSRLERFLGLKISRVKNFLGAKNLGHPGPANCSKNTDNNELSIRLYKFQSRRCKYLILVLALG